MVVMVPISLRAAVGFAGLTRRVSRGAPALALVLVSLSAAYNVLKLETQTEVRSWKFANSAEIRAPAEKAGASFALIRDGVPERPAAGNGFLRRLSDTTNP